jgi:hypothetical protein
MQCAQAQDTGTTAPCAVNVPGRPGPSYLRCMLVVTSSQWQLRRSRRVAAGEQVAPAPTRVAEWAYGRMETPKLFTRPVARPALHHGPWWLHIRTATLARANYDKVVCVVAQQHGPRSRSVAYVPNCHYSIPYLAVAPSTTSTSKVSRLSARGSVLVDHPPSDPVYLLLRPAFQGRAASNGLLCTACFFLLFFFPREKYM